jgi:hypothetical protein
VTEAADMPIKDLKNGDIIRFLRHRAHEGKRGANSTFWKSLCDFALHRQKTNNYAPVVDAQVVMAPQYAMPQMNQYHGGGGYHGNGGGYRGGRGGGNRNYDGGNHGGNRGGYNGGRDFNGGGGHRGNSFDVRNNGPTMRQHNEDFTPPAGDQ